MLLLIKEENMEKCDKSSFEYIKNLCTPGKPGSQGPPDLRAQQKSRGLAMNVGSSKADFSTLLFGNF